MNEREKYRILEYQSALPGRMRKFARKYDALEVYILSFMTFPLFLVLLCPIFDFDLSVENTYVFVGWCIWVGLGAVLPWRYVFEGDHRIWAGIIAGIASLLLCNAVFWEVYNFIRHLLKWP